MKAGDLIHMPGEHIIPGFDTQPWPSVGIVIDDDVIADSDDPRGGKGRIGIMWVENWGKVYYEPRDWLEVVSEAVPKEA
jgi:hypothetical protein